MEPDQRGRQALQITSETSEPRQPCKCSFHYPTSGQQDKALRRLRSFDDDEFHTSLDCLSGSLFAGVALVCKRHFYVHASRPLHLQAQVFDLCSILLIGRCGQHCEEVSSSTSLG